VSDAKIHELFAAWNADAMTQRSVGDVPAPVARTSVECGCGTKIERIGKPIMREGLSYVCDACMELKHSDDPHALVEKLATSVERNAVVKFLRELATYTRLGSKAAALLNAADAIEKGEHHG
jgi:hypothetical protein